MNVRPKTILCDIDGTIAIHKLPIENANGISKLELLEGTKEKFSEWDSKGYNIILITGRKESMREVTEKQLKDAGLFYDKLLMGVGGGDRILINDKKPDGRITAFSYNVDRNDGIKTIDV